MLSCALSILCFFFFFFKQKTAYEMRISDWSSDVCSSDLPAQLPNHGWSHAFGVGGRFGVLWKPTPSVAVGATYMTKVRMSRFKGYDEDLLAGSGGSIDAPEQFGAGISVKPKARLTIGFDFVRTNWSGVKAFSEKAGFGWGDHNIYKFGASYELTPGPPGRTGPRLKTEK